MAWRLIKMKTIIVLMTLTATCLAAPASQSLTFHDDGSYRFYYETGKEGGSHTRSEVRNPDGVVIGKYSYEDPDGEIREVNYRADNAGFVANGDVSVQGAPKGQFPAVQPEPSASVTTIEPSTIAEDQSVEEKVEDSKQSQPKPMAKADHDAPYHYEEEDHDDMQDLALEESSSANDPPEAFPPGFFLQKFQGLRRFPEPTKEDKPVTTEAPQKAAEPSQPTEEAKEGNQEADISTVSNTAPVDASVFSFRPPQPFLAPEISHHQEWASSMFHQPVYVFSYHQPDSYGYHYYF